MESSVKEQTDNQGSHSKYVSNVTKLSRVRSGKGTGRYLRRPPRGDLCGRPTTDVAEISLNLQQTIH